MGMERAIEQRLDRAMATKQWLLLFPQVRLKNLVVAKSDRSPLLLQRDDVVEMASVNKRFRFENIWLLEAKVDDVVKEGWRGGREGDMVDKLGSCVQKL